MGKFLKTCLILSVILLFISGLALIATSYLPFSELKARADSLDPDGNFQSFSVNHVMKLRYLGIFMCVAGGLIYIGRKKILDFLSDIEATDFLIRPNMIVALIFNFMKEIKWAAKREDRIHIYAFVLIMLLAVAVRVYYLPQPLYNDESRVFVMYIYDVMHGVKGIIPLFTKYYMGGHHMFHTLLAYLAYKFFGSEQWIWITRLPALIAGILLVPASYLLIRIFYNKNAALLAAAIVASSSSLIFYSTNARGHTMICLVFLLILALGAYLKNNSNIAGWHLFAILSALGFYTIPIMLYPYGVVITWLFLSILVKDTTLDRRYLLQKLFVSIVITVFLTFLFYSPVIFFGTGLKSLIGLKELEPMPWAKIIKFLPGLFERIWESWNQSIPFLIRILFVIGFFVSLLAHKKLSAHRVPLALAATIWLLTAFFIQRSTPYHTRYWLFLLLLYIGVASSGVIYLFRPVELVVKKYRSAVFAFLAVVLSLWLSVNKIYSEPYLNSIQAKNFDESGKYIEFEYINACLKFYLQHEYPGNKKVLIIFPSSSTTDFWISRLDKYCGEFFCKNYFIYDLKSYLSEEARVCHRLYVLSSESIPALESLLEKNGVSVSNYSTPQLMHRFDYANLYKMDVVKDCDER